MLVKVKGRHMNLIIPRGGTWNSVFCKKDHESICSGFSQDDSM